MWSRRRRGSSPTSKKDYHALVMVPTNLDLRLRGAARLGDQKEVANLLKMAANVNSCTEHGLTALHLAVSAGEHGVVTTLLDSEAHLDTTNQNGQTALHIAAHQGDLEVVRLLTEAGCDVNATTQLSQMTPLHLAARQGHSEVCRYLIRRGADVDITDQIEKPAFYYATKADIRRDLRTEHLRKEPLADKFARKVSLDTASQHSLSLEETMQPLEDPFTTSVLQQGSSRAARPTQAPPPAAMPPTRRPPGGATGHGRRPNISPRFLGPRKSLTRRGSTKSLTSASNPHSSSSSGSTSRLTKKGSFRRS